MLHTELPTTSKHINENIALCRATAALAVVLFHSSSLMAHDSIPRQIVVVLINWCVPVFLMISGTLFFDKRKSLTQEKMIRKNVVNILLIIVVWGMFYNLISIIIRTRSISLDTVFTAAKMVITGDTSYCYQFWYLYFLVGIYLLIPILKPWIVQAVHADSQRWGWKLILGCWGLVAVIIPTAQKIAGDASILWGGAFLPLSSFLLYTLLGVICSENLMHKLGLWLKLLWAAQAALLIGCILWGKGDFVERCIGYGSVFTCNMAIVIFEGIRKLNVSHIPKWLCKGFMLISDYSLGIYIFHVMFIWLLGEIGLFSALINTAAYPFLIGVIATAASMAVTFICKRIPVIRKLC